ncbi:MAG: T9SS type A sorting domain-containing protein, partial [Candidatus Cloacimonetes bacterium]|nr:T9SS type A sorting domain-containing protein [Candidatus Cloacimonadota bacterium]
QDFVMKTIVVPGVPTNLATNDITLTYTEPTAVTLSWVAPADVNVDSYKLIWNNGEVQNIGNVLNWTTPALDAGTYTWKVCAVNNTPTKNYTPVRVQINGRSTAGTNNPKADGAWAEASFTVAIAPAEYNVNITSNPTGVAIYVDGTNSGEFTPHTFIMAAGTSAVYTVVLDHYTWVPVDFAVTNIASDLSCEFLGTQLAYDIPADEPTELPPDIPIPPEVTLQILIETVGAGGAYIDPILLGDLPEWVNPAFTPTVYFTMDLIGLGPWTITFTTSTSCWVAYYLGGNWHTVQSMLSGTDFIVTFTIDTPPKDISDIPVVLGDSDPTLPVELSTFAATITAENYVNICWITQSETGMTGFNVYRNVNNNNLSSAHKINPNLIDATNTSSTQIYNLIDKEVENGNTYYYWLECVDRSHNSTFHETSPVYLDYITPPILPEYTTMRNAYPNPFRAGSGTTIEVDVKAGDNGTVTVYNILGQVVKTFPVAEGINNLTWNARDSKGNLCGNGIYFYKLSTKTINQTKKMVIIK